MHQPEHLFTIAENWKECSDHIGMEKHDAPTREFARRVFYAGFVSAYAMMTQGVGSLSESEALFVFAKLERETTTHLRALMSGDA